MDRFTYRSAGMFGNDGWFVELNSLTIGFIQHGPAPYSVFALGEDEPFGEFSTRREAAEAIPAELSKTKAGRDTLAKATKKWR